MKRFLFIFLSLIAWSYCGNAAEYIVISGGPALRKWEKTKIRTHDVFWGNFIESALLKLGQLKAQAQPIDKISWLVYRPAYLRRSSEEGVALLDTVQNKADAMGIALYWFDTADQLINYLNQGKDRSRDPIVSLDFFGHSNKVNWMFDYSNEIDGCSTIFLHTRDLNRLAANIFSPNAVAQSWGCHSGEYYTQKFKLVTGVPMTGAIGKTDFSTGGLPTLSSTGGRWTQ